jgi:hypothetical protein
MKDEFIQAIHDQNKLELTFYSKEDSHELIRICAPMDYGPSRRANNKDDRYHFWDYDSDTERHTLSLLPDPVIHIKVLSKKFNPAEFITWNTQTSPWFVQRDWDQFS